MLWTRAVRKNKATAAASSEVCDGFEQRVVRACCVAASWQNVDRNGTNGDHQLGNEGRHLCDLVKR
jgi:hypothetical protein